MTDLASLLVGSVVFYLISYHIALYFETRKK